MSDETSYEQPTEEQPAESDAAAPADAHQDKNLYPPGEYPDEGITGYKVEYPHKEDETPTDPEAPTDT